MSEDKTSWSLGYLKGVEVVLNDLKELDKNEEHWITEWGEMLPWHFIEKILKKWE